MIIWILLFLFKGNRQSCHLITFLRNIDILKYLAIHTCNFYFKEIEKVAFGDGSDVRYNRNACAKKFFHHL